MTDMRPVNSRGSALRTGISDLLSLYEGRRAPFDYAPGEGLPAADTALTPLTQQSVSDPDRDPAFAPPFRSSFHRKQHALRRELTGASELCALHGLLVAHLRKRSFPEHAPYLFHRLWDEHADHLLEHLDPRWLVSAVTTFGDHGLTAVQRSTGLALNTFFGMIKLYESERLYSGHTPRQPFALEGKTRAPLPLEMDAYALVGGGLDVNMIARLWTEAAADPVIAPLAHHLLDRLMSEERSLFFRLADMKARKAAQVPPQTVTEDGDARRPRKPRAPLPKGHAPVPARAATLNAQTLRWGLVSTVKAPLAQVAGFAAHHIDLGAEALHIHLDAPDPETEAFLKRHPKIHVTRCDAEYWRAAGKTRMQAHQLRQSFNATRVYRGAEETLDWLGHIDVDEFLIGATDVRDVLGGIGADTAFARFAPAEALAPQSGPPRHFKLTHVHAGVRKAELQDIYPVFGMHLYGGFLSHTSGKVFARTGIPDARLGIHSLKYKGEDAANRAKPDGLRVAHLHAPSWETFRAHLDFRREHGSYRPRSDRPELGQAELIRYLAEEEGEDGLRAFFDEVCADTPALRDRLDARGMLLRHDLDLDQKMRRVFGEAP